MASDHVLYALTFSIFFNVLFDAIAIFGLLILITDERAKHLKINVTTKKYGNRQPSSHCQKENEPKADFENTIEIIEINNQFQTRATQKDKKQGSEHYGKGDMTNQIFGSIITLAITICDLSCSVFLAYGLFNGNMNIVAVWLWIFPVVSLVGIFWGIIFLECFTTKERRLKEDKGVCNQCCCTISIINVIYFALANVYYFNLL